MAAKEENRVAGAGSWLLTLPLLPGNRKRSMTFLTRWRASVQTHMPAGDIGHSNYNTATCNQKTWVWLGLEEVVGLGARRLQRQKKGITMKWQGSATKRTTTLTPETCQRKSTGERRNEEINVQLQNPTPSSATLTTRDTKLPPAAISLFFSDFLSALE